MRFVRQQNIIVVACVLATMVFAIAQPVEAQSKYGPLFDKFNFKVGGSWVGLTTEIRLDSEVAGAGTTLNFEDDLDLGSNKTIPTIGFQWQISKKHRIGLRWQDINRDSSSQALTEIKWGDETIPINADISLGFDISQMYFDYTYFPWVNDRWAAGFGLGLRVMDFSATLAWKEEGNIIEEGSSDVQATGPLPYLYFEYRRLFSDNWRFVTGLGWIYVKIDDIEGGQWVGRVGIEYLLGDRWSFGATLNIATVDVDWAGLKADNIDETLLEAGIKMDVNDLTLFAKVRF